MTLRLSQVALNPIQWTNLPADPSVPGSVSRWLYGEPSFRADYPRVLRSVAAAGFDATMMEVLDTQTLQDYARMVTEAGLRVAPGYASIGLPEDAGVELERGSAEWQRWFNGVRRKAEESNYFGLDTVFLAPEVDYRLPRWSEKAAIGHLRDSARLERQIEMFAEAADVLAAEGVRAGLHNHVGTWIETEDEIEAVLAAIPAERLSASFDIGHLAWAGIDPVEMTARHADRILDLHLKDLDLALAARTRDQPGPYDAISTAEFFVEPGRGDIDLDGVLAALPEAFAGWIIIEVDQVHGDPDRSAALSRAWVESTFAS
ncbi:sugar phosphate isomerase/epimerase [Microbacterium sp. 18062]|uniref:sugar phosphate isomerase/epimerase family protein n=1 Tax=Microbacterium sp. 18062 TaxID=2681410 RepID=UPI00135A3696|nr:sugar phosphate isomerase/epimerase [Microbacterium sp. 18062]